MVAETKLANVFGTNLKLPMPDGEDALEDFCLRLFRRVWNDENAQLEGRKGQQQFGVDIVGNNNASNGEAVAVQCKGSQTITPRKLSIAEIDTEVGKAKNCKPPLSEYIIAYAGERDQPLQQHVRTINATHSKTGLFRVVLLSWPDLLDKAETAGAFDLVLGLLGEELLSVIRATSTVDPRRPESLQGLQSVLPNSSTKTPALMGDTSSETPQEPELIALNAQIDVFRNQIQNGEALSASGGLQKLLDEKSDAMSNRIRFRAYANLGAALEHLGRTDEAITALRCAVEEAADEAEAQAYLARVLDLEGDNPNALIAARKALELKPDSWLAATILISSSQGSIPPDEIERLVENVVTHADVASSLAYLFAQNGQIDRALDIARKMDDQDGLFLWIQEMVVGELLLRQYEEDEQLKLGLVGSPVVLEEIEKAAELLGNAWQTISKRPDQKNLIRVLVNRSLALRLLERHEEAAECVEMAYSIAPEEPGVSTAFVLLQVRNDNLQVALDAANQAATNTDDDDCILLASHVAIMATEYEQAKNWAKHALSKDTLVASDRNLAIIYYLRSCLNLDGPDAALKEAEAIDPGADLNLPYLRLYAELARRANEHDKCEQTLNQLLDVDASQLSLVDRVELSDSFADAGLWSQASDALGDDATVRSIEVLSRRKLFLLYRADMREEGRAFYESLDGEVLNSGRIRQLGAAIFDRSGMLQKAVDELTAALEIDDNDLRTRLDWIGLSVRSDQEQLVKDWIKAAPLDFAASPEDLLELAHLLVRYLRVDEGLKTAYRTLLSNWGHSEHLHMVYVSLFLPSHAQIDGQLQVDEIGNLTAAKLVNQHGEERQIRIDDEAENSPGTYDSTHPFASKLLGLSEGDEVTIAADMGEDNTWKVLEVKHAYIDLLHKAMYEHETLFPGSHSLGRLRIDLEAPDGFEPLFEVVRNNSRRVEKIAELYNTQHMPVDTIATMLGTDPIDASLGLRFKHDKHIDACHGTNDERARGVEAFVESDGFVIEPMSLEIWQEIELLSLLGGLKIRPKIVQSTLDLLLERQETAERAIHEKPGQMVHADDQFTFVELSDEVLQANFDKAKSLHEWARRNCDILPTPALEQLPKFRKEHMAELFHKYTIDSFACANSENLVLLSDDRRLRELVNFYDETPSSWTQAYLMHLKSEGHIDQETYTAFVARLVSQRIKFTSVNSNDLIQAATKKDMSEFELIATALTSTFVDPKTMVNVVSGYALYVWNSGALPAAKMGHVGKLLHYIVCNRPDYEFILIAIFNRTNALISEGMYGEVRAVDWRQFTIGFVSGHFIEKEIRSAGERIKNQR